MKKTLKKVVVENYDDQGNKFASVVLPETFVGGITSALVDCVRTEMIDCPENRDTLYHLGLDYYMENVFTDNVANQIFVLVIPFKQIIGIEYNCEDEIINTGI